MVSQIDGIERIFQRCQRGESRLRLQLTFPYGDTVPSQGCKRDEVLFVSALVSGDFLFPELGVGLRHPECAASFMPMPKAPIDKNAGPILSHDDIRMSWQPFMVETVSEPPGEEEPADDHLRLGVFGPDGRHILVPLGLTDRIHHRDYMPSPPEKETSTALL